MKRNIILSIVAVALIGVIVAGVYFLPMFFSKKEHGAMVYIYPDMTQESLNDTLKSRLGEKFGTQVLKVMKLKDVNVSKCVGAYYIPETISPYDAAKIIQFRQQTGVKVVFNNVRTMEQLAERISQRLLMSKDELYAYITNKDVCAKYGKTLETMPSIFFPDSYEFYWNVTPEKLVDRMYSYYNSFWTDERKAKAKAMKLSLDDVSTIASIVEEETAKRDERGKVARLYLNRLKKGMLLQADPTVKYAIGDFSIRRIWGYMLKTDSPYNTYKNKGLPPGPIRMPLKETLDAVLNAPQHNYIYMCAKEDFSGYHNFAVSYSEHLANARRYQRELNKRKIK